MECLLLWVWFCGAYQMWEEVRDQPPGPDPGGAFYSPDLAKFYKAHPELHGPQYLIVNVSVVILWPLVMMVGILHAAYGALRHR
jgi:hypothetical protein